MKVSLNSLPSFIWIILIMGGLLGFIGSIIFGFFLLATVEGVASAVLLIVGFFTMAGLAGKNIPSYIVAGAVVFYALMGMAIDQTGNIIFNYPFKYLCPQNSTMNRDIVTLHPLPGRTDITQDFRCLDNAGITVKRISPLEMIVIRFIEYVVVAYLFIGFWKLKNKKNNPN